jgi:hypothetical protein
MYVGQSFGETDSVDYCRRNECRSGEIKDHEVARARGINRPAHQADVVGRPIKL